VGVELPYRQNFPIPAVINPPKTCLQIEIPDHPDWKAVISGLLFELTYWFNWERTGDTSGAQCAAVWKQVYNSIDWSGMSCCCEEQAQITRINPDTGNVEVSTDNGATWRPAPGGFRSLIVTPIPPVTSGVAATKCDAATNVSGQVEQWITQVSGDFDTAVSLIEFGIGVIVAVAGAVLVVLTGGGLLPAELALIGALSAGIYAAWNAGKVVFDAYWTTENKDKILCAAYCTIGDDGSFSEAQFSEFWNKVNADLPPGPAKILFMGFLSSVGQPGLCAMAATGMSADADCEDCTDCIECEIENWNAALWYGGTYYQDNVGGVTGTEISRDATSITIQSADRGDGQQVISLSTPFGTLCCGFTAEFVGAAPDHTLHNFNSCEQHAAYETLIPDDTAPFSNPFTMCYLQMDPGSWTVKFTITP